MSSTPILATPNVIECDASGYWLEAILMQDEYLIAFESRKLKKREQLKSTYDKEMMAIMQALVKW